MTLGERILQSLSESRKPDKDFETLDASRQRQQALERESRELGRKIARESFELASREMKNSAKACQSDKQ